MQTIKITSWNIKHLERLLDDSLSSYETTRRAAVIDEIHTIDPDILCLIEGPRGEVKIDAFCDGLLNGKWRA
ncbi:MAG: hypothetical protein K8R40_04850, partial [Anaerolineaceae bacterium]|nr:hypothetical protein [Anaerolineaceae bacterium]